MQRSLIMATNALPKPDQGDLSWGMLVFGMSLLCMAIMALWAADL